MYDFTTLKQGFLVAPDSDVSDTVKRIVSKWDEPEPKAIQILEVIDCAVWSGGACGFAIQALDTMLRIVIEEEGTTYDELVKLATWRTSTTNPKFPSLEK